MSVSDDWPELAPDDLAGLHAYIMACPDDVPYTLNQSSRLMTRWLVEHLREYPEDAHLPSEGIYADVEGSGVREQVGESLFDAVRQTTPHPLWDNITASQWNYVYATAVGLWRAGLR